jgi:hypothetical protein
MQTAPLVESIQADLAAVVAVGDEAASTVASQIATALGPALRMLLLEAATEAAGEISLQLPEGRVEVRLQGGEPALVYMEDAPAPAPSGDDSAAEARITLRLPGPLKARVEAEAAREGVSVNAWLIRTAARGVDQKYRRVGNRVTGFAHS